MGAVWHEQDPGRWQQEQQVARRLLSNVRPKLRDGVAEIQGVVTVENDDYGHVYGKFGITVQYPDGFTQPGPDNVPNVYLRDPPEFWETGNDSHIESDWRLCLCVASEMAIDFSQPEALDELIGVVKLFLFKEFRYQKELLRHRQFGDPAPEWLGDDRAHGATGVLDAIEDAGVVPGKDDPCPCGQGRLFRACHRPAFLERRKKRSERSRSA